MLLHIYHEFVKVLAWTYDDLNTYDNNVIQHTIKLEIEAKPYRQKIESGEPKNRRSHETKVFKALGC